MEAVLKNLSSTAELLAVAARSSEVEQWDKQTLSRAFAWAGYCEHIFCRFQGNPAIRRILERQLQLTNFSLQAVFPGYTDVSFTDLSRCQHLLLVGLLNNPELPISLMKILFDTKPGNIKHGHYEDVTSMCSHIIQCKSACKILSPLTDLSAVGADAEVQGSMLMERLHVLQSQSSDASQTQHFLNSVLLECESEHFCLVVASALLTQKNSDAQTASMDFLLDWLKQKDVLLQHMCSALPTSLLQDLAKEHLKFRNAYCDILKKWATNLEYSINDGEWVQRSTNPSVSFQKLIEHFSALLEACPSTRRTVEEELNTLKISDGDLDVRGLSVWGDLLSEMYKCKS
ncbi:Fanconi anemia group F protein isoform 1-T2 [Aulostomus maculatus]